MMSPIFNPSVCPHWLPEEACKGTLSEIVMYAKPLTLLNRTLGFLPQPLTAKWAVPALK